MYLKLLINIVLIKFLQRTELTGCCVCVYVYIHVYVRETDWLQGIGCTVVEADFKAGWRPREVDVVVQIQVVWRQNTFFLGDLSLFLLRP